MFFVKESEAKEDRCRMSVSDSTGFHFYQCTLTWKFKIKFIDRSMPGKKKTSIARVCGNHKRVMERRLNLDILEITPRWPNK